jgi:hypothetical protein
MTNTGADSQAEYGPNDRVWFNNFAGCNGTGEFSSELLDRLTFSREKEALYLQFPDGTNND